MEAYFGQTTPHSLVLLFLVAAFAIVAVRSLRYQGLQRKVHPSAQAIKLQEFLGVSGVMATRFVLRIGREVGEGWRPARVSKNFEEGGGGSGVSSTSAIDQRTNSRKHRRFRMGWRQLPCSVPLHTIRWLFNIHSPRVPMPHERKILKKRFSGLLQNSRSDRYGTGGRASGCLHACQTVQLIDTHRSINGFTLLYVIPPTAP